MASQTFKSLLSSWQEHNRQCDELTDTQVRLSKHDLVKLEALAETFHLDTQTVIASLLHQAIFEIEEKMPYVQGSKVIRIEEGEEIFEDIGPTPRYLAAQKDISRKHNGNGEPE
ncbi:hypothetical protein [Marinobacterium arenosum]|uniref:hypothetical protein n=1 Tax=Marinobacterium arenosum TaxID=2862496 RepID=UPI001C977585|nr:hypothetical protein [Marinobacterium arenosum]MBY4676668.1 hypothetical protein [Marinobacterium arenosum]